MAISIAIVITMAIEMKMAKTGPGVEIRTRTMPNRSRAAAGSEDCLAVVEVWTWTTAVEVPWHKLNNLVGVWVRTRTLTRIMPRRSARFAWTPLNPGTAIVSGWGRARYVRKQLLFWNGNFMGSTYSAFMNWPKM